ncbi:MAG: VWA domain-containing protein [Patescibacteria group bacterium]|nr:VWA domain-containing protein [Patescibacteria group bacterium]
METPKGVDVAISFDTTGSMYPCLTQVRRHVEQTARRLFRDISGLRLAIIAHGDYCDASRTYVTKKMDFSTNLEAICRFVRTVGATNGGDSPECYELVLREARGLSWQAGNEKVLVMIGDDVPHEKNYPLNKDRIDWRNELELLLEAGIHVYGVHAMPGIRQHSRHFYKEIASKTKGYYLTLDQFSAIVDIIFAICYKQAGNGSLKNFQQEIRGEGRMSRNMAFVFQMLTGEPMEVVASYNGLVPVPAGRFQVLRVDEDQAIRDFVEDQGLVFKTGRGFYQFTKSEMIQEKKEVVLMDKNTGDMFSGEEARRIIGLPFGMRGKIKPVSLEQFNIFVQSTSYNRKLIGGSLFLYEVTD